MKRSSTALWLLVAACAAPAASAASGCTLGTGAQLDFGSIVPLASTGNVDSNTGSTLTVRCGADVVLPPRLRAASSRAMSGPGGYLPYHLSLLSPGGPELPDTSPGAALSVASDDVEHVVTLHGRVRAVDFAGMDSGSYSADITLTIEY